MRSFTTMRRFFSVASTIVAVAMPLPGIADEILGAKKIDVAPQQLSSALQDFSEQSGLQVAYVATLADNVSSKGTHDAGTAEAALSEILDSTGLEYQFVNADTVAIGPAVAADNEAQDPGNSQTAPSRIVLMAQASEMKQVQRTSTASRENSSSQTENRNFPIEEIIVTAQKREQRAMDVPLSLHVVSADEIDRRGLVGAEDYLRGIPGVNQVDNGFGQSIVMRGIETSPSAQNFFSGTTFASYFGETPTTNSAGIGGGTNVDLKLVDIERVEVLRGPQGTGFGNSSMGGAVRTIPVAPKLDHIEGKVAAGYSGTSGTGGDNDNLQAVGNLPLIKDKFGIRATAYQYQDSGFYRNRAGSDATFQAAAVTPYGAQASALDEEEVGDRYVLGGRIAGLYQASDDLRFTLSYLSQKAETDGFPLANSGTYEQTVLQVAPEHAVRGQGGGLFDTDIDIANAMMEYNLGWANLLAIYSHTKSGSIRSIPLSAVSVPIPASAKSNSDHREDVGEIRLVTQFDGAWNFLAGLYAEELEDDYLIDYLWHGDPATNFFAPGERFLGVASDKRNLKQKAAFGEASWELLQGLTLTGGVRAYDLDRTVQVDQIGALVGERVSTVEADASGSSFRGNLSYKFNEDVLVYAGWSQGFRLGRPQFGLSPALCDPDGDGIVDGTNITVESTNVINSDEVDSYELGAKLALLDRRLAITADVFRMEWSGMPVLVRPGDCGLPYTANAGEALSEGFELQANFQIAEPFRVDFGGSWIHARLIEDVPSLSASKGDRLPGSPEVNANLGLQYEFMIGAYKAFVRSDSIYVGPISSRLSPLARENYKSDGYVKVDASARVEIGNLNIDLFVRNLTNEDAFTFRGAEGGNGMLYGYRLRPRTIGLQLGYTFE